VSDRSGNDDIWVMRADGRHRRRLTTNGARDRDPSWSANGRWIAFESNRTGNWEIYEMRANGSHLTRLTFDAAADILPAWRGSR
jgi:TolB protein